MKISSTKLLVHLMFSMLALTSCDRYDSDKSSSEEQGQELPLVNPKQCSAVEVFDGQKCRKKQFFDYCEDENSNAEIKRTVQILLDHVGADNCADANSSLRELTTITIPDKDIVDISPLYGLSKVVSVDLDGNKVKDISALSSFSKMEDLQLYDNNISDLEPLSHLKNLKNLHLESNAIEDVSPLATLKVTALTLSNNNIRDIGPLESISSLAYLDLRSNKVENFSALKGLGQIRKLLLDENPLDQTFQKTSKNCPTGNDVANEPLKEWCTIYSTSEESLIGKWKSDTCELSYGNCYYTMVEFKPDLKMDISFCSNDCQQIQGPYSGKFAAIAPATSFEGSLIRGIALELPAPQRGLFVRDISRNKLRLHFSQANLMLTIDEILANFQGFQDTELYSRMPSQ
ncbi:leucine-rich repeat domain-containing protein [Pseudobacteriovorax antillogorgiicola]|uniref:Leucine-rich repeat-containing protein n=1 Tax=Pseudobacteriovorax antillogorgiicola TaxID=1513793 RepID=A0A1Y6CDW0_9BACT|nr:leucine-rich repeat protein [Pseudobacteriovorax antillogorgiicola]TCS47898.1 leucine rich repeat (LRR) protein [Pseudobacteriovorax antillogorgiicola]SMF57740.1 Leucine-rich repeat-containing protein [Pseudobacteriovorax antillogorgiicola]